MSHYLPGIWFKLDVARLVLGLLLLQEALYLGGMPAAPAVALRLVAPAPLLQLLGCRKLLGLHFSP